MEESNEAEARDGMRDLVDQPHRPGGHDSAPLTTAQLASTVPPVLPETQTVDDVLELAVHDVGALIPAERSVLFVYDKGVNQLKPQFVFPPSTLYSKVAENDTPTTDHDKESSINPGSHHSVGTGFPPVMGMISACFLHKRCMRMQEPHPVRSKGFFRRCA